MTLIMHEDLHKQLLNGRIIDINEGSLPIIKDLFIWSFNKKDKDTQIIIIQLFKSGFDYNYCINLEKFIKYCLKNNYIDILQALYDLNNNEFKETFLKAVVKRNINKIQEEILNKVYISIDHRFSNKEQKYHNPYLYGYDNSYLNMLEYALKTRNQELIFFITDNNLISFKAVDKYIIKNFLKSDLTQEDYSVVKRIFNVINPNNFLCYNSDPKTLPLISIYGVTTSSVIKAPQDFKDYYNKISYGLREVTELYLQLYLRGKDGILDELNIFNDIFNFEKHFSKFSQNHQDTIKNAIRDVLSKEGYNNADSLIKFLNENRYLTIFIAVTIEKQIYQNSGYAILNYINRKAIGPEEQIADKIKEDLENNMLLNDYKINLSLDKKLVNEIKDEISLNIQGMQIV